MDEYQRDVIDEFHRIYYDHIAAQKPKWLGRSIYKSPLDLWVLQEILFDVKPDIVIETGTGGGGSAYFIASVLELLGGVRFVVTIDREEQGERPSHPGIHYVLGDSVHPETQRVVGGHIESAQREKDRPPTVLVDLDSNHSPEHVYHELKLYAPLVTPGSYAIVEDTNVSGTRVVELGGNVIGRQDGGNGAMAGVERFLAETAIPFEVDRGRERFMVSFNPSGFLRRIQR